MADPLIQESKFKRKVTLSSGVTSAVGSLLYHDGTNYALADADSNASYAQLVALQIGTAEEIEAAPYVVLADTDAPYTQDAIQYVSGTAGSITETAPTGASDLVQAVGVAHSTSLIEINIQPPKEITETLGKPFMLATAIDQVLDTGPAAGTRLQANSDSATYVWFTPRNCVGISRAVLGWGADQALDTSDTYTVSVSSAASGEANDATTDSISAAAFTVSADEVAEATITAGLNASGIPTPGEWVHIDIDKAAEGTGGEDPIVYSVAITYQAVGI